MSVSACGSLANVVFAGSASCCSNQLDSALCAPAAVTLPVLVQALMLAPVEHGSSKLWKQEQATSCAK
jgi:hypothetical protein